MKAASKVNVNPWGMNCWRTPDLHLASKNDGDGGDGSVSHNLLQARVAPSGLDLGREVPGCNGMVRSSDRQESGVRWMICVWLTLVRLQMVLRRTRWAISRSLGMYWVRAKMPAPTTAIRGSPSPAIVGSWLPCTARTEQTAADTAFRSDETRLPCFACVGAARQISHTQVLSRCSVILGFPFSFLI